MVPGGDPVSERHWDPQPGDDERIRQHVERQHGFEPHRVLLDDGTVVPTGEDAKGEADEHE